MSKPFQLAEYFNWFLNKYQEIQKELHTREAYRIISIDTSSSNAVKLKIHIIGTGKEITYIPEELAQDDFMLEGFSKKDIRAITYYACKNINQPKFKIAKQSFCDILKKIIFHIKKIDSEDILNKTADEIYLNRKIISNLSSEDAHRLGYTYGCESTVLEKERILKLKPRNK